MKWLTGRKGSVAVTAAFLFILIYFGAYVLQERKQLTDEVRAMAPGKFMQLTHGKVHYIYAGDTALDLIIFIHGSGITGLEVWKKNIPYFIGRGFSVLAFDLYGRGFSDRPPVENTPELFDGQFLELLSKLKITKPFYIVAMSMGAMVAIDYLQLNEGNVKKLVLIDPAATGDYRPNVLLKAPVISQMLMTLYWYPRAVENQRKEFVDEQLFNEYSARLKYFMDFEGYKFTMHSTWMNTFTQNRLGDFKKNADLDPLLLYGEYDPYFNERLEGYYSKQMSLLQVIKIDGTGHMPHYEKPDQVNKIIYTFFIDEL